MDDLKQAQRRRLRYIEFLILFKGQCSRLDLIERFSISEPAATKDFSLYSDRCPKNLQYDVRAKRYILGENFVPSFEHSADAALSYLGGTQRSIDGGSNDSAISAEAIPRLRKILSWRQVAPVTRAIHMKQSVDCLYSSMSAGSKDRVLSPHAIIFDGNRWHFRACDHEKQRYQDYSFSRVASVEANDEVYISDENDNAWHEKVELELSVHPSHKQPESIQIEYEMSEGSLRIPVRAPLVGYFLRSWLVDFSENYEANYRAYQLALTNRVEVYKKLDVFGLAEFGLQPDFLPECDD